MSPETILDSTSCFYYLVIKVCRIFGGGVFTSSWSFRCVGTVCVPPILLFLHGCLHIVTISMTSVETIHPGTYQFPVVE